VPDVGRRGVEPVEEAEDPVQIADREVDGERLDDVHAAVLVHREVGDVRRDRGELDDPRVGLAVRSDVVVEQRRQEQEPDQQREPDEGREGAGHGAQTTRVDVIR
jgi:hypothetical protein